MKQAIENVAAGGKAPGLGDPALAATLRGPDTVDGIAPAGGWDAFWRSTATAKRVSAPWHSGPPADNGAALAEPLPAQGT